VVRNPERVPKLPRETVLFAAGLAAGHSKAKNAGRVSVHMARCEDVSKPRGLAAGKVELRRWESVTVKPTRGSEG
jgi:predicted ribosome quality control (RQC) complex YloA/Tae2 family protein